MFRLKSVENDLNPVNNVIARHVLGRDCARLDIYWDRKSRGSIVGILRGGTRYDEPAVDLMRAICERVKAKSISLLRLYFSSNKPDLIGYEAIEGPHQTWTGSDYLARIGSENQYSASEVVSNQERMRAVGQMDFCLGSTASWICRTIKKIPDTAGDLDKKVNPLWKVDAFRAQRNPIKVLYKDRKKVEIKHLSDDELSEARETAKWPVFFFPIDADFAGILNKAGEVMVWVDRDGETSYICTGELLRVMLDLAFADASYEASREMFSSDELAMLRSRSSYIFWPMFFASTRPEMFTDFLGTASAQPDGSGALH